MRITFECYAIYSAVICTMLTFALAFTYSDDALEWVAKKTINLSFLIYGPVLATICIFGLRDVKSLMHLCTVNGVQENTNLVNVFVLVICLLFGLAVTTCMLMEKTFDMAQQSFRNESSIIYQLSAFYFQFNQRSRHRTTRENRRERRYHRMQSEIERAADQEVEQRRAEFEEFKNNQRLTMQPSDCERKPLLGDE